LPEHLEGKASALYIRKKGNMTSIPLLIEKKIVYLHTKNNKFVNGHHAGLTGSAQGDGLT
jgi:hypothetical protein